MTNQTVTRHAIPTARRMSRRDISVNTPPAAPAGALYRTIWRWHLYAGLFVLPFILILSVTGAIYLFKPQTDRWEERAWQGLPVTGAVGPDRQLAAAIAAHPGARFTSYRLPRDRGDAAMIHLILTDGEQRDVYVSPRGAVVGSIIPGTRLSEIVSHIHGTLLLGQWGDWLVELAASWTIVMMLTGLYLWWPRPFRAAGTFWPRLSLRGRPLLKDFHRVTGFWIAGLVLVTLASGLPWAGVWGGAFAWARGELGWVKGPQDWKVGPAVEHGGHDHAAMMAQPAPAVAPTLPLSAFVARAEAEHMAFPVAIIPPGAPQRFGPPNGPDWMVKSEAQNRWLNRRVSYDAASGVETGRSGFADLHVVDRVVNTGIAWHEGQLFGVANQIVGVLTALSLFALSLLGAVMWLRRRPAGTLGAPPAATGPQPRWPLAALALLAILLPLFGASVLVVVLLDRVLLRSFRRMRRPA